MIDLTQELSALVRDAVAEVDRRRTAGAYPAGLVERIDGTAHSLVAVPSTSDAAPPSNPRPASAPFAGTLRLGRRSVRHAIAWYVRPLADEPLRLDAAMKRVRAAHARVARQGSTPRRPRRLLQLVPFLSVNDAVGDSAIRFQRLLRGLGYETRIYADVIDRRLLRDAKPARWLPGDLGHDDAVMYHLSIGTPLAQLFAQLPVRRAMYYHNVSPVESVAGVNQPLAQRLLAGRAELALLAPRVDIAIAPSTYSAGELRSAGANQVATVPLPLSTERLRVRRAAQAQPPRLLFVGRFMPHKGQDLLIRTLAALRSSVDARLVLAGRVEVPEYLAGLRFLAHSLDVAAKLDIITRPLSDRELGDLYASSSLFLCASRHEGFCVPIVEAMAFSIPVMALAAAAVPETVGGAGVVIESADPFVWAEVARRLLVDETVRSQIATAERERLRQLDDSHVAAKLNAALAPAGWA